VHPKSNPTTSTPPCAKSPLAAPKSKTPETRHAAPEVLPDLRAAFALPARPAQKSTNPTRR
jgi:hypothetical protein